MKRHEVDIFSLIAGLTFSGIAVVYLIASLNDRSVNGRIVIPVALISLGTAGLAGAVARMARRNREVEDTVDATPDGPVPVGAGAGVGSGAERGPGERPLSDLVAELDALDTPAEDAPRPPKPGPPAP